MDKAQKKATRQRRMRLRLAIENYLLTVSPMRLRSTTGQIRAAAKQMERANRIPLAVANALGMSEVAMKGEFDSPSKPATDAYREGWDQVFQTTVVSRDRDGTVRDADKSRTIVTYGNGCPILEEK